MVSIGEIRELSLIGGLAMVLNTAVMGIDLISGLYKATQRHEKKTSYGLHRTVVKFLGYIGSLCGTLFIDVMLAVGHLWPLLGIDILSSIPVMTILMCIFNCSIEIFSIREKSTAKSDRRAVNQLVAIVKTMEAAEVKRLLEALGEKKG